VARVSNLILMLETQ